MAKKKDLVSVVIVSKDRKKDLIECVDNFKSSSYKNMEIIVVDNNSNPPLIKWLPKKYPKVKLVSSDKNVGAAEGRNIGIRNSTGKYILFSDDDAYPDKKMVEKLVEVFEKKKKVGAVQPLTFDKDNKDLITGAGHDVNTTTGRVTAWGVREHDFGQYEGLHMVPMVGCVWMTSRAVIDDIGMFDEDYFIPYEDSDICKRMTKAGYKNYCLSEAITWHQGPKETYVSPQIEWLGITSPERAYRVARNKIMFMRKHSDFPQNLLFYFLFLPAYAVLHSLIILSSGRFDIFYKYWLGLLSGLMYSIYYPLLGFRENYKELDKNAYGLKMLLMAWTEPITWLIPKDTETILDIGCGEGLPMELIKMRYDIKKSVGVDLYEPYIKDAKKKGIHDKYVLQDITKLKIPKEKYDVVMALQVLEHLTEKQAMMLLSKMEKIAKKRVIIATPIGEMYHPPVDGNELQMHKSEYVPEDYRKLGYTVFKFGSKYLFGDDGIVHKVNNDILKKLIYVVNLLLTPLFYLIQPLSDYHMYAYKDVKK